MKREILGVYECGDVSFLLCAYLNLKLRGRTEAHTRSPTLFVHVVAVPYVVVTQGYMGGERGVGAGLLPVPALQLCVMCCC